MPRVLTGSQGACCSALQGDIRRLNKVTEAHTLTFLEFYLSLRLILERNGDSTVMIESRKRVRYDIGNWGLVVE